jgi:hypothetical protein
MAHPTQLADIDWNRVANIATDALSSALGQVVQSVRIDTRYLPPMNLVGGGDGGFVGEGGAGEPTFDLGAILKPKLTIQLSAGNPIVYAPYGDPGEGSWLPVIAGAGLFFYIAYALGRRRGRRG